MQEGLKIGFGLNFRYILGGIILGTLFFLPYFILQGDAWFVVLDQLDDSVPKNMLRAQHFFDDNNGFMPEIMNGVDIDSSLSIPVLLNLIFEPMWALIINMWMVAVFAFVGMYLLLAKVTERQMVAFLVAGLFALLRFYATFSLSVMGIPWLIYAFINLYNNEKIKSSLMVVSIYSICSSLVLAGFVVLGFLFLAALGIVVKKQIKAKKVFLLGILIIIAVYAFKNADLFLQMFMGKDGYVSHRMEAGYATPHFWPQFWELFINGHKHSKSFHKCNVLFCIIICFAGLFRIKHVTPSLKRKYIMLEICFITILLITVFAALITCPAVMAVRDSLGGVLQSFHFERVYFMYPTLWYIALGLELTIILEETERLCDKYERFNKKIRKMGSIVVALVLCVNGAYVVKYSTYYSNFLEIIGIENEEHISWNEFYAVDLYDEIDEYVGKEKSEYRVASLAVHPAVALYNGFYTIDGYVANYPLEYKHEFRRIIEKELEKNAAIRGYFDKWGNRCYIYSAELGKDMEHFSIPKDKNLTVKNFEIDCEAMKMLNGDYLISAVEIENAEEIGLNFEKIFENEKSYYRLYLYSL